MVTENVCYQLSVQLIECLNPKGVLEEISITVEVFFFLVFDMSDLPAGLTTGFQE